MTANPLKGRFNDQSERVFAPAGDSPEEKAERQRFWLERGNLKLAEAGMGHLHWQCLNGHYFIEERMEASRRAMLANPNFARAA
jgi:hypothetical protein